MASPILKTNDSWNFRFSLTDTAGAVVDLNGYKLRFRIKKNRTDEDVDAVDSQDFDIATSVLYKDIQVEKEDTDIAEGTYWVGTRYISPSGKSKSVDTQITVKKSISNTVV